MANLDIGQVAAQVGKQLGDTTKKQKQAKGEGTSQLSNVVALDALSIVRDELSKLGCNLKNYKIIFNASGFDIEDIEIDVQDRQRIIDIVKQADPSVRHEFSGAPVRYAYMAANALIAKRVDEELGLDYEAYEFQKGDGITVSVSEPKNEKPLPPDQEIEPLSQDIINGVNEPLGPEQTQDEIPLDQPMEMPPAVLDAGEEEGPPIDPEDVPEFPEYQEGPSPEEGGGEPEENAEEIPEEPPAPAPRAPRRPMTRRPGMEF